MQMRSISIFAVGSAAIAPLPVFLRYLLKQPIKVASTREELLDLFEDRRALLEGDTTLTSSNDQGRAYEHFTLAASSDLAQQKPARPIELSRGAASTRNNNGRDRSLGTFASAEEEISAVGFRNFYSRRQKESSIHEQG
jgi:hypothetical protein